MIRLSTIFLSSVVFVTSGAEAQDIPAADRAIAYYDRHLIDVSNLRHLTEGSMIGDMMIHADAMFTAEAKWK
ncbi:MAG: hypothetical protein AAGK71_10260 [Pseudomonadota bacterium]